MIFTKEQDEGIHGNGSVDVYASPFFTGRLWLLSVETDGESASILLNVDEARRLSYDLLTMASKVEFSEDVS